MYIAPKSSRPLCKCDVTTQMPHAAHQQKHLCFSPSLTHNLLRGDLSHQDVGEEWWRRGLDERRALSDFALIIQAHEASDLEVYGLLCKCGYKESWARLSAQTVLFIKYEKWKDFTLWTNRRLKKGKHNMLFHHSKLPHKGRSTGQGIHTLSFTATLETKFN